MSAIAEKHVSIATRLYEARDVARNLLQKKFPKKMQAMREVIEEAMNAKSCSALVAAMEIVALLQKEARYESGMEQTMILAAYVEMVEPSEEQP